ncbi:hemolysin family protein [Flaviaesturariibacter terrae]
MIETSVIAWFFVTILMMAFFSGIEMAFYSVNRFGVELKKKQGRPGAQLLSRFIQTPEIFVSVMVIGFTISLVCFVIEFIRISDVLWHLAGLHSDRFDTLRNIVDIAVGTFLVLVFGEFIPKAFFRAKSNIILSRFVWIVNLFYKLLQPLATLFVNLSEWVLRYIFNVRVDEKKGVFSGTDFDTLFQQSNDDYEPEDVNTELFENALELPKTRIRQCLVPRKEIIAVEVRSSVEEVRQKLIETKLSKLVVFEGNIDHIVGYVHQLDLFKNPQTIGDILLPIPAVPESMSATDLINKFTREGRSIAWVVDEFGGTAGIVTMEDVLEEIFGEIHDEYDSEEFVERRISENEYILSGRLELDYLCDKFDLSFPEDEESETLSGYIINHHETIPKQKERIIINNYEFDVINVSDTRIEMVKLKVLK